MTGRELLTNLQALPPDDLDLEIELYLHNSEDGESCNKIEVLTEDKEPYYKGDGPWSGGSTAADERLIYIRS